MSNIARRLRTFNTCDGGKSIYYDYNTEYFTMEIHHGGEFRSTPKKLYKGGTISHFDYCHPDHMSLLELDDMAEKVGHQGMINYHFRLPGMELDNGLMQVKIDGDVMECMKLIPQCRVLELYLEHMTVSQAFQGASSVFIDVSDDHNPVGEVYGNKLKHQNMNPSRTMDLDSDDGFYDSDYCLNDSDDDQLFETHVDKSVEWTGLQKSNDMSGDEKAIDHVSEELLSDYASSDELISCGGSSDEEGRTLNKQFPEFRADVDMNDVQFKVGMLFGSAKEFKEAVREYAIRKGKEIRFVKNEKKRVRAKCKEGCNWFIFASVMQDESTLQVKTYENEHTCSRNFNNKHVKSTWLSKKYVESFRTNPNWSVSSFKETIRKDLVVNVSRSQVYRAKRKAMLLIEGNHVEQYSKLWDYCEEIKRTNPGSTMVMQVSYSDGDGVHPRFERLYVCLGPVKQGLLAGCRQIIGVDGCHLKGPYGGQMLTAVGIDGNNCIFPVAWAVVEGENKSSWMWFLDLLQQDLGIVNQFAWTFISDKQKGLIPAFQDILPNCDHRFCVRHFYNNFKQKFKGKALKDRIWNAARASTVHKFDYEMGEIKKLDLDAYNWLVGKSPTYWSRSHFSEYSKCDILLNNLCESFNAYILEARDKPVLTMLERIRSLLMTRLQVKREKMRGFKGTICPKIHKKLEKIKEESANCIPIWSGDTKFQVMCPYGDQYSVNLDDYSCSCRSWDLSGIPCPHAVSSIYYLERQPEDYVHVFYKKETFLRSYEPIINPLNGPQMWPKTGMIEVLPPIIKSQPGRPKKARRKEQDEKQNTNSTKLKRMYTSVKCKKCGKMGHNSRTCKNTNQGGQSYGGQGQRPEKLPVRRQGMRVLSETTWSGNM